MENLISLINKLQRACTALGDHGEESALPTLWDSLPAIAVVGGQVPVFFLALTFWVGADRIRCRWWCLGCAVRISRVARGLVVDGGLAHTLPSDPRLLQALAARFGSRSCMNPE
jgi:hypothetical protein